MTRNASRPGVPRLARLAIVVTIMVLCGTPLGIFDMETLVPWWLRLGERYVRVREWARWLVVYAEWYDKERLALFLLAPILAALAATRSPRRATAACAALACGLCIYAWVARVRLYEISPFGAMSCDVRISPATYLIEARGGSATGLGGLWRWLGWGDSLDLACLLTLMTLFCTMLVRPVPRRLRAAIAAMPLVIALTMCCIVATRTGGHDDPPPLGGMELHPDLTVYGSDSPWSRLWHTGPPYDGAVVVIAVEVLWLAAIALRKGRPQGEREPSSRKRAG